MKFLISLLSFFDSLTIIVSMDLLTEGQKLAIFFTKNDNMVEMTCVIEKVYDDRLDLVLPQYFMRYIEFLQVGKRFTAKIFTKMGTIDFNSIVISSPLEETFTIEMDVNSLKLTPGNTLPVVSSVVAVDIYNNPNVQRVKTFEISTEYVKFYSDKRLKIEDTIEGALLLPQNYGIINFKAMITEIDPVYDNEYTAVFSTMTEADRQSLLYYMYMYSKNSD